MTSVISAIALAFGLHYGFILAVGALRGRTMPALNIIVPAICWTVLIYLQGWL